MRSKIGGTEVLISNEYKKTKTEEYLHSITAIGDCDAKMKCQATTTFGSFSLSCGGETTADQELDLFVQKITRIIVVPTIQKFSERTN